MSKIDRLCLGCMKDKEGEKVCPFCGYEEAPQEPYLPLRTVLQERYTIGKLISANGESAVYLGWDNVLGAPIEIREFFPTTLAGRSADGVTVQILSGCEAVYRDYLGDFLRLARTLARMRELPAMVPVYDIFEANGTAYTISEHTDSVTLKDYLEKRVGRVEWEQARSMFLPVLNLVSELAASGIHHLGISPSTLLMGKNGKLRLTGFSIPALRTAHTDLKPEFFPGFTPVEQYYDDMPVGVWSDIYSLSAVIFTALMGSAPPDARQRLTDERLPAPASIAQSLPPNVTSALAKGLRPDPNQRTRSMELFKSELTQMPNVTTVLDELKQDTAVISGTTTTIPSAASQPVSSGKNGKQKKKPPFLMIALISVSAVLLIVVAILLFTLFGGNNTGIDSSDSSLESSEMSENSSEEELTAPNIIGRDYESLRDNSPWDYITIEMAGEVFDDTIAEGTIASQDPEPGTPIQEGTIIRVYVSRGSKMREVPNVAGMTSEQAVNELKSQGFNATPVEKSGTNVPDGQVIETDPPAGESVEYGSQVFVFVSNNATSSSSQPSPSSSSSTAPPEESSTASTSSDSGELSETTE